MAIIRLAASADALAIVHVGNHTAPYFLGWRKATFCYRIACEEVMGAFSAYRDIIPHLSPHFLLTEGSKHWIRDDRISGALLWCYNLSLLGEVVKTVQSRKLIIECDASREFLNECVRRYSMELVRHQEDSISGRSVSLAGKLKMKVKTIYDELRQDIDYTKRIYASICRKREFATRSTKEPPNRQVVLLGIQSPTNHRFGSLVQILERGHEIIAFRPHEDAEADHLICPKFTSIHSLTSRSTYIGYLLLTVYLLFIQRACLWIMRLKNPFFVTYFKQSYRDILQVVLGLYGLKELFASYKPAIAIIQGSYNGPHTKRILHAAHMARIPTILIEQKIIFPDQFAYQLVKGDWISGISDTYIVAHKASRNALISWGINPKLIKVGYRGATLNTEQTEHWITQECGESDINEIARHSQSRQCLLILFSDYKRVNLNILAYIQEFANDKYCFLIREHPNTPLEDQPEVISFLAGTRWANLSAKSWTLLESFNSVIAITACSSAGLEAIEYGAFLVWLPFCTDLSVTYASMIDSIGNICTNSQELKELVLNIEDENTFDFLYNNQRRVLCDLGLSPAGDLVSTTLKLIMTLHTKSTEVYP